MSKKNPVDNIASVVNHTATICIKIKQIWFSEVEWKVAYREVSRILKIIKAQAREAYGNLSEDDFLRALDEWAPEDLKEVYESSKEDSG